MAKGRIMSASNQTDAIDVLNLSRKDMTFREIAAIQFHASLLVGVTGWHPATAAKLAIDHVNALAAGLAQAENERK